MIYTRYGSEVEIIGVVDPKDFRGWTIIRYLDGRGEREVHVTELKADSSAELVDAVNAFIEDGEVK